MTVYNPALNGRHKGAMMRVTGIAKQPKQSPSIIAIKRLRLAGLIIALGLFGILGGWSYFTEISGAVVADGAVVVESDVKKVQHQTGGIVGEIRVRNGDRVKVGDVLVRLDETLTRANLDIVRNTLNELNARKARLRAERDGLPEIHFPANFLVSGSRDPEIEYLRQNEATAFQLRASARAGQKGLLLERKSQLVQEIAGYEEQSASKGREIDLIARELEGVRLLWKKNLIQIDRLTGLERDAEKLRGDQASLGTLIAQAKGKIGEIGLQILQIDRDMSSEVSTELRDVDAKISELSERRIAAEDQMRRVDLRSPQDGIVHQSIVHTIGGVISPGEVLMVIVPEADQLSVETKISPRDIDQVHYGQSAILRFTALNQSTTPEISGTVDRISADVTKDERTGQSYFTIRIVLDGKETSRLGSPRIVPGMPVETMIKTDNRNVLSYLVKPLFDQIAKAFRE